MLFIPFKMLLTCFKIKISKKAYDLASYKLGYLINTYYLIKITKKMDISKLTICQKANAILCITLSYAGRTVLNIFNYRAANHQSMGWEIWIINIVMAMTIDYK